MKRFYLFVLLFLVSFPVLAKNKISMVTYFPVPYVAYSQVNTTEQMDIGLTSTCDMKLGCSETSATLNAARVNLNGGKLNLDGGRGIKGYTVSLGNGSGEGRISFQNVRIQTGNMESVNAQDMKVSALELFGKAFPSCKEKDSSGQMQWTSLKLKGASSNELYLACGELGESTEPKEDCSVLSYKLANKSKCCPGTPTSDSDCYTEKTTWTWESFSGGSSFMSNTFGSDWITQACEKNCWKGEWNTDCGMGGSLFDNVFNKSGVVIKTCSTSSSCNYTCYQNKCYDTKWDGYKQMCDSSFKDWKFVILDGYLTGTVYDAYCPTKSSGSSPYWKGRTSVYTCTSKTERVKNGW